MLEVTRKALQEQMDSRKEIKKVRIDGYSDFLFHTANGYPVYSTVYTMALFNLVKKHNKMYKDDILLSITPHVLRHTFCTNMANSRMTPNNLKYVMGHKNISMTLGYYTHASCESAMEEMLSLVV